MRVVGFHFNSVHQLSYKSPVDTNLVGVMMAIPAVVSTDPTLTMAQIDTVPADKVAEGMVLTGTFAGLWVYPPFEFKIDAGQIVYVAIRLTDTGFVGLTFDDILADSGLTAS